MPRPVMIAAALLGGAWYLLRRYAQQQREMSSTRAKPEHLQTWEGEGGGVPVGGSRIAAQVQPAESASDNPMADRLASRLEAGAAQATDRAP